LSLQQHSHGQYPPEPQLIAAAIAAFAEERDIRYRCNMPLLKSHTYLGIVMRGLTPILDKIPVTEELRFAVLTGQCPSEPTTVERLVYPVPIGGKLGLYAVKSRKQVLQCLEAFVRLRDNNSLGPWQYP
jgi:hypothetical protein